MVGRIAGAIYADTSLLYPFPPMVLIPGLTFKVRRIMEHVTDLKKLSKQQKQELAKDIQRSVVPMLFSFDIEARAIEKIAPAIEAAVLKAV
jgi:ribonuclease HII